jgi:ABC-type bacteriocin/lantibiotic exporter with double-glycine peptidase domain
METADLELIAKSINSKFGQNPLKNFDRGQVESLCSKVELGETIIFFQDKKRAFLGISLFILLSCIPPAFLIDAPFLCIGLSIFPLIGLIYLPFQFPSHVNKLEVNKEGLIKYGIFNHKYYTWKGIKTLKMSYVKDGLPSLGFDSRKSLINLCYFKEYSTETVFGTLILLAESYS